MKVWQSKLCFYAGLTIRPSNSIWRWKLSFSMPFSGACFCIYRLKHILIICCVMSVPKISSFFIAGEFTRNWFNFTFFVFHNTFACSVVDIMSPYSSSLVCICSMVLQPCNRLFRRMRVPCSLRILFCIRIHRIFLQAGQVV